MVQAVMMRQFYRWLSCAQRNYRHQAAAPHLVVLDDDAGSVLFGHFGRSAAEFKIHDDDSTTIRGKFHAHLLPLLLIACRIFDSLPSDCIDLYLALRGGTPKRSRQGGLSAAMHLPVKNPTIPHPKPESLNRVPV